jgi:ribosomal protein S20
MSLSGVSSGTPVYANPIQNNFKQRSDDFKALKSALQSGDISAAQSAFSTFKQDLQTAKSSSNNTSQPSQDFQSLESALSSGDISAAQKAFASFQSDVQAAHKSHHHHHHKAESSSDAQTQNTASVPASGSLIGTVLNQQA